MTSKLFKQIEDSASGILGWATLQKQCALASMILATRPKLICEIGIYGGASALPMALACKSISHGLVVCIDPYSAEVSVLNETKENSDWWKKLNHEEIMNGFFGKVSSLQVQDYVFFMRKKSDDVSPQDGIGLLHIDGNHSIQAVKDAERFCPHVSVGGLCIFDDCNWPADGVSKAMEVAIGIGFKELYRVNGKEESTGRDNDWAVFQRIK